MSEPSVTLKLIKVLYKLGGSASIDDLVKELGLKKKYIHSYISILVKKEIVERKITPNGILYCLKKEP